MSNGTASRLSDLAGDAASVAVFGFASVTVEGLALRRMFRVSLTGPAQSAAAAICVPGK